MSLFGGLTPGNNANVFVRAVASGGAIAALAIIAAAFWQPAAAQQNAPAAAANYTPDPALAKLGAQTWPQMVCRQCHGSMGNGEPDIPQDPQGADFHTTKLTADQIAEVIRCGRPGTAMPHFDSKAYTDKRCYGSTAQDLGDQVPPSGGSLSDRQINAIVAFIETAFVGKPEPTYEDCIAFWGPNATTCTRFPKAKR